MARFEYQDPPTVRPPERAGNNAGGMNEGRMEWEHGWTWYRTEGRLIDAGPAPLVILHGGPGAASDYVAPIAALARRAGRPCVLYDQIGCGRSQHLPDAPAEFWSVELFRRELDLLISHLGVAHRYHILGQSWGGMLGMEHALELPTGLRSLVIANSPASMELWVAEANRLRSLLPGDVQDTLNRHEHAATTDSAEYKGAVMAYYERHLCRIPFPEGLERSFAQMEDDPTVYETMNGPSEFHVIGKLKGWDITPRLSAVGVPVLVISGEHDEATPAVVRPLVEALPDARWELFADASHCTHLEQPDRFLDLVEAFLSQHDL
jgi:L-proline amide hydrolase